MSGIFTIPQVLLQTLILALGQLWANRVRALLTTLGIVIGVASTIAIVGGTEGLRAYVLKEFENFGASRFVVFPRNPREAPNRFSPQQIQLKYREALEIAKQCPSVLRMTPVKGWAA
ncbi:MAG: ABC transporter permease, partial [Phycisphaerales bacterium]|nr:ABC transporter permease [Phycisphaerales bacterium]